MSWGERAGRVWFYRMKGAIYLEVGRQWILPIMGASAASKYLLGLSVATSLVTWFAVAAVAEVLAVCLGWLERRSGATSANYDLSKRTDPFKMELLSLQAKMLVEITRIARMQILPTSKTDHIVSEASTLASPSLSVMHESVAMGVAPEAWSQDADTHKPEG